MLTSPSGPLLRGVEGETREGLLFATTRWNIPRPCSRDPAWTARSTVGGRAAPPRNARLGRGGAGRVRKVCRPTSTSSPRRLGAPAAPPASRPEPRPPTPTSSRADGGSTVPADASRANPFHAASAAQARPVTGRAGTGVRSATIENCTAAALGLPPASRAAPAAMSTRHGAPEAAGVIVAM